MAYNRNIPQPADLISNSQAQLLANFQAIDSGVTGTGVGFSRNHVTITDGTNGGLHHRVDYFAAVAAPTISGFVASAYPKTVSNIELFYRNAVQDMQITNSLLTASTGDGFMPGGLQIRSGTCTATGVGQANAFTPAFPTACVSVVVTGTDVSGGNENLFKVTAISASSFTLRAINTGLTETCYYIATGY